MARNPIVILYSPVARTWEAWREGRPLGQARSLDVILQAYPTALPVSKRQCELADKDRADRLPPYDFSGL